MDADLSKSEVTKRGNPNPFEPLFSKKWLGAIIGRKRCVMVHKESETIEFKKSTAELKEAVVAIAAMLNKHGHREVYFGISDDEKSSVRTLGG